MVKIGINGFGRIGRLVLRVCMEKFLDKCTVNAPINVVAVNDPMMNAAQMAYLFKYDSTHGIYPGDVTTMGDCILIDGQRIGTTQEKVPSKIPWSNNCVDYVVEATGIFKNCADAKEHINGGVRRVIVTANSDAPMFVMGVNHDCYTNDMKVVSASSCTTNCLAPLVKIVHENFFIEYSLGLTVHGVTITQPILDGAKKKWRSGRGGMQNIIPATSGASQAIGKVYPELHQKCNIMAVRVPTADVSLLALTAKLGKEAPMETIKCKLKSAANGYMKGIFGYTEEPLVSSDFIGDTRSCIFDAGATMALTKCFVKFICWYDNEYGYANRVVDLVNYVASREDCP